MPSGADVRSAVGVPVIADFAGAVGTPVVVDKNTGWIYTVKTGDLVVGAALGGTVTSVALTAPSGLLAVSGSPITSSGTLALSWSITANQVLHATSTNVVGGSANFTYASTGLLVTATGAPIFTRSLPGAFSTLQSAIQIGISGWTPSAGAGPSFLMFGDNASGTKSFMGRLSAYWANPTAGAETAGLTFNVRAGTGDVNATTEAWRVAPTGTLSNTGTTGTAGIHLKAGTTAASTAPLKFTSGSLQTTAEAGAVEFLTDKFYGTITTGAARKELTLNDAALTSGRLPMVTTNGRLTDSANATLDSSGNITLAGAIVTSFVGPHAFGGAVDPDIAVYLRGTFTRSNTATGGRAVFVDTRIVATNAPGVAQSVFNARGAFTTAATSAHPLLVGARFDIPAYTSGGGSAPTEFATVYIEGAPTDGTANYALHVDAGTTALDGQTIFGAAARLKGYTVGTLPAGTQGDCAFVTDALAPAFLVAVATGGAAYTPVSYNGAAWACA